MAVSLILEANEDGCRIKVACLDLEISFNTFRRWCDKIEDNRKGPLTKPKNKLSDQEVKKIVEIATSKDHVDDSPHVIVAKLADDNKYIASVSTFYRVLDNELLLKHRGKSKAPSKEKPTPLVAFAPNQIWSWDITYMKSFIRGQFFYLYLFMDIWSRKIVGYDIFEEESMENSSQLIEKITENNNIKEGELVLHADNGGPMKGFTMLAKLFDLGVASSFSRPRVSNDNPYSESLFKTLKYIPDYPDHFNSLAEAKQWTIKFVDWYNNHHLHSGINFVTPSDRHEGNDVEILKNRHKVFENAKSQNPERWNNRKTKSWEREEKVYLNYLQEKKDNAIKATS